MKKAGIIGGIGPESTLDYYRGIIDSFKDSYQEKGYPEIVIDSLNLKEILSLADRNAWDAVSEIFAKRFEILRYAGASFGAIASNTPHKVFHEIQRLTPLPLISIVEATRSFITNLGLKKVCLLGTEYTMRSDFYSVELANHEIKVVIPSEKEIKYIQEKLMTEIELGIIKAETKKSIINIINRIIREEKAEGIILGCTEFPLIIKEKDIDSYYIDTMKIHIDKIVEEINK